MIDPSSAACRHALRFQELPRPCECKPVLAQYSLVEIFLARSQLFLDALRVGGPPSASRFTGGMSDARTASGRLRSAKRVL
jgi:hypothetical protein